MATLFTNIWAAASVLGLLSLGLGLGTTILWRLPVVPDERLEWMLVRTGTGLLLLSYLPFILSLPGWLTPPGVRLALLLCALLALFVRYRRPAVETAPTEDTEPASADPHFGQAGPGVTSSPLPPWLWALLAIAALHLGFTAIGCFTPIVDYDGLAYHVDAPSRWLQAGAMRLLPTHLFTQAPMGVENLFMLLLPVAGDGACKPLIAALTVLAALSTFALGRRLGGPVVGCAGAALFLVTTRRFSINSTSIDVALAFAVVTSSLAILVWHRSSGSSGRRWLWAAALLAGFGCCIKLTGALCAAMLAAAVAALGGIPLTPGFLAAALICAAPWYLRAWVFTGNPSYPFAYSLLDGRGWSTHAAHVLTVYYRTFEVAGASLADRIAAHTRRLWKLVAAAVLAVSLPSPRWVRGFLLAAAVFAIAQLSAADVIRFLLPAIPFVALSAAWWLMRLSGRLPVVGWAVATGLAAVTLPGALKEGMGALPLALGIRSADAYVHQAVDNRDTLEWANGHLPAGAHVLFGPDARAYTLRREVYWSSSLFQQQIRYDTPVVFEDSLRRAGITHLILNFNLDRDPQYQFELAVGWRAAERQRLMELASRSKLLYEAHGVALYALPRNAR